MALRLDQPLLRIGNKVTNWVPAVGAVAGATVVGAAAVVAGGYGLYYAGNLVAGANLAGPDWAKRRVGQLRAVGESVSLAFQDLQKDITVFMKQRAKIYFFIGLEKKLINYLKKKILISF